MELQGKVIAVLPERSGVSARGEWKSQSFVIETHEQYPKQMVFDVFGADRLAQFNINTGDEINVSFDITAHEYQGRWFNNIRAWNVVHVDPNAVAAMQGGMQPGAPFPPMGAAAPQATPGMAAPTAGATAPFPPAQPAAPAAGAADTGSADDLPF